jgi:hypothetical protein
MDVKKHAGNGRAYEDPPTAPTKDRSGGRLHYLWARDRTRSEPEISACLEAKQGTP